MTYSFSKRVLGIKIDDISSHEVLKEVSFWLGKEKEDFSKIIVTSGPEFLLTAQKDPEFAKILNAADLSLPDGFGLHLAGIKNRVPGTDLVLALCKLAAAHGWTIGLVGRPDGLVEQAAERTLSKLRLMYPNIKIDNKTPDILFVALGHPEQEKFLWKKRGQYRVGIGVGGAFDYISGEISRPGKILRAVGLEWLGRLFSQPRRLRRILNATIVFPIVLLLDRGKVRS